MSYFRILPLIVLMSLVGTGHAADITKPVVTVNGTHLYEADLNQEIQILMPTAATFHSGISEEKMKGLRTKALASLVEKELKYQDALARNKKLSQEALQVEIDKVKTRLKKKGDFDTILKGAGFTPQTFGRFIERKVLADKIEKELVDDKVSASEDAAKAYYEQNMSRYVKPEEYRASQILVKVPPSAQPEERKLFLQKAESLLKRVKAGEDFADVASQESDDLSRLKGGDIGAFHAGQTDPHFEETVRTIKVGEISGIVETLDGYHIIKLVDKKASRQLPFGEVKEKILTQLKETERQRLYDRWLQDLKAKAKISYPAEG